MYASHRQANSLLHTPSHIYIHPHTYVNIMIHRRTGPIKCNCKFIQMSSNYYCGINEFRIRFPVVRLIVVSLVSFVWMCVCVWQFQFNCRMNVWVYLCVCAILFGLFWYELWPAEANAVFPSFVIPPAIPPAPLCFVLCYVFIFICQRICP